MVTRTLEGKVALITGASEGIGFAIAKSLAERGASLVLVARNVEKLKQAHGHLTATYGGNHLYASADVSNFTQVHDAVRAALERYSVIDILVNNAGLGPLDMLERLSPEILRTTLLTNLYGPLLLYRAMIPVFKQQQRGTVIDVISQAGLMILDQNSVYASTKWGQRALSLVMEKELPHVHIYRLYPGVVNTALWDKDVSELKMRIRESGDPNLQPNQIGEFVAQLLENPSLAETPDVMLQPQRDGSMEIRYLPKDYLEL